MIAKLLLVLMISMFGISQVGAEQYALIVGVNRYPNLSKQFQLNGAVNDANAMSAHLQKSGFKPSHIRRLGDDQAPEMQARREVILSELRGLSARVQSGDLVFAYFALHGSQQPVVSLKRRNEADDLDEIILPSDVKKWDGQTRQVGNAIVDDELDELFRQMRLKGAFVVASFDTCHAGSMARGVDSVAETEKARFVPMRELGIPSSLQQLKWQTRGVGLATTRFPKSNGLSLGGFVGLYASQSDQVTKEMSLGSDQWRGVFTHHLIQALSAMPKASYRQVGEQVLLQYRQEKRWLSSPQFEGTGLDYRVFDLNSVEGKTQWVLDKHEQALSIAAGSLHQFDLGARFSLHRDAATEQVLGYATVVDIQADRSRLMIEQTDAASPQDIFVQAQFARLRDAKFQRTIRIAMKSVDPWMKRLYAQLERQASAQGVTWTMQAPADYQLVRDPLNKRQICIARIATHPPCGDGALRFVWRSADVDDMSARLQKAVHKLSLAHRLNKISMSLLNSNLLSKVELILAKANRGKDEPLSLDDPALLLKTGDQLRLSLKNRSNRALDLTVLSLNNAMGIETLFPEMAGANRIEAGGEQEVLLEVNNRTRGKEQVFVFVSEVQPARWSDFSFLAQTEVGRDDAGVQDRRRGEVLRSLSSLLSDPTRERGGNQLPQTAIRRLSWITR